MGRPKPSAPRRKSSTLHYQTFPTKPPTSRGPPPTTPSPPHRSSHNGSDSEDSSHESPLPKKQLIVLAIVALAEQTALNSISPYLPEMASTFPEVKEGQVGIYVGLIASSFALAQFATNFFWGWLSDRVGRKPVILLGTLLTLCAFIAFGFCRTLWQAILVQAFMGLVNGNQGIVSTCLGEITDRSNQSRAFTYLPVVYGIGAITGPVLGGLLVLPRNPFDKGELNPNPYLLPNLFAASLLLIDLVVTMLLMEECLDGAKDLPPLGERVGNLFAWLWQFTSSTQPTYIRRLMGKDTSHHHHHHHRLDGVPEEDEPVSDDESHISAPEFFPVSGENLSKKEILSRDTILLLVTYFIFQLANISYNSLYPIFGEENPPTGRNLSPEEIGLSLGFAGVVTIIFQVFLYGRVRDMIGNKTTYRVSFIAFFLAFMLTPFVPYKEGEGTSRESGNAWLYVVLGTSLVIKTVASVGGLTAALLLITNSARDHSVLGALNGLAQTLSAAGRAVGPFISGSLFSAGQRIGQNGTFLPFGIFGGVTLLGFLLCFGIKGKNLEAEGWDSEDEELDEEEGAAGDDDTNERTGLIRS